MERLIAQLRKHYSDFEVWQEVRENVTIEDSGEGIRNELISKKETAVRAFSDGKIGFAYHSGELNSLDNLLNNLSVSIQHSIVDDDNVLPLPEYEDGQTYGSEDYFDVNALNNIIISMKDEINKKSHLKKTERISASYERKKIVFYNSKKGFQSQIFNKYAAGIVIVVERDGEEKMEWDFVINTKPENIETSKIVKRAHERALKLLNSSPTNTGIYDILLESRAAADFLEIFAQSFIGENIYKKKTLLTEKMEFSEKISIKDTPFIEESSNSYFFDGEGVKGREKYILKKGKVENYLFDHFYGKKMNVSSTGNAIRNKVMAPPKNGISTVIIENGAGLGKELDNRTVIGVVSLIGMHLVNAVTGDFSVGFEGYILEKGLFKKALSNVSISGNLKDLFKNIIAVGDDLSVYGQAGSPSLLVSDIVVSGI